MLSVGLLVALFELAPGPIMILPSMLRILDANKSNTPTSHLPQNFTHRHSFIIGLPVFVTSLMTLVGEDATFVVVGVFILNFGEDSAETFAG